MTGSLRVVRRVGASRLVAAGLAAGVLVLGAGTSKAQRHRKQERPHHETNASRQARIARAIRDTYSHRWEVVGGGGYMRWRSGEETKKNNEVSWDAETDYFLNPKLAIVADAQGSFGHAYQEEPLVFTQIARPQINEYFFTGGANYRFYRKEKVALSVQVTAGMADGIFSSGAKGLAGPEVGLWNDGFRPAGKASFNVDYNLYPNLAVRLSPTYVLTDFSYAPQATVIADGISGVTPTYTSTLQNSLGLNFGIVYRFGRQK